MRKIDYHITYKTILKDYFLGFRSGLTKSSWLAILYYVIPCFILASFNIESFNLQILAGLPLIVAIISTVLHTPALPFQMYLIPLSLQERKDYIQKMLEVKIVIPIVFCILWNLLMILIHNASLYTMILELFGVFLITFILGMLQNHSLPMKEVEEKYYGSLKDMVVLIVIFTDLGTYELFSICISNISRTVFILALSIYVLIYLPLLIKLYTKWDYLKRNLAIYEMIL